MHHFLEGFLNPPSIAFYGASEDILKNMGTAQLLNLLDNGYKGTLYPIHLRLDTILGLKAYKTIAEVPSIPDLAVVILPNRVIPQIFTELAAKGVFRVILVTAGFREIGNLNGSQLVDLARKLGITFIGPNCLGILNTQCRIASPGAESIPCCMNMMWVNYRGKAGNISIASQSGTVAAHTFMMLEERGIGLAHSLSIGNEAMVDVVDCLEFFEHDTATEIICLYLEEIKRGPEFFAAAKRITRDKPIIAIYVGGTEGGARAARSHTGSMAGNDRVFDAMFHQTGIIRATCFEDLMDTAMLFSKTVPNGILPAGNRLAIVTNAGGPGATMADRATRLGMQLPSFGEATREKLAPYLPPTAQVANPLDYTFSINPAAYFDYVPKIMVASGECDAMVCYGAYGPAFVHHSSEFGKAIAAQPETQRTLTQFKDLVEASIDQARRYLKKYKRPIIYVNLLGLNDPVFAYLNDRGFPTFRTPHQAIEALHKLQQYATYRRSLEPIESKPT